MLKGFAHDRSLKRVTICSNSSLPTDKEMEISEAGQGSLFLSLQNTSFLRHTLLDSLNADILGDSSSLNLCIVSFLVIVIDFMNHGTNYPINIYAFTYVVYL